MIVDLVLLEGYWGIVIVCTMKDPGSVSLHILYRSSFQSTNTRPKVKFQVKQYFSHLNETFSYIKHNYHDHQGVVVNF